MTKRFHDWRGSWGLVGSLSLLLLMGLSLATRRRVVVWPGADQWVPYGFADRDKGGHSQNLDYRLENGALRSDFMLSEDPERSAGLVLNSHNGQLRDCSGCSVLRLVYRTRTLDPLRAQILIDAPGRTCPGDPLSKRYLFWELPPSLEWTAVDVPLSDFETPDWWFRKNHVPPVRLPRPDFHRVLAVAVCESEFTPSGKALGVDLRSAVFLGSLWPTWLLGALSPLPWLIQRGFRRRLRRGVSLRPELSDAEVVGPEKLKPYGHPILVTDRDEVDFERIAAVIASRYPESELTLTVVSRESGIPESRISQILEKRTDLHFKPYLNQVRIQEAVRLLRDTDLTVSEIAFQVGYANTTHFNRVFRTLKGSSPGEFRRSVRSEQVD